MPSFWELVFDFKWYVALLSSRDSIRRWKPLTKVSKSYFINFLTGFTALLTEIKSFLIRCKTLCFFGLLNPCSYFLWPLNTLGIGQSGCPLGNGELTALRCAGSPLTWGRARTFNSANTRLGCGLGKKWPLFTDCIWYILCDTWRDKRDLPALNWNLSFLSLIFSLPYSSLLLFSLHCDDLMGTSVNRTNASSDYNLLIVVYNEKCKLF